MRGRQRHRDPAGNASDLVMIVSEDSGDNAYQMLTSMTAAKRFRDHADGSTTVARMSGSGLHTVATRSQGQRKGR